jgi:transcriptional regulator with AAA-type ATPase domain
MPTWTPAERAQAADLAAITFVNPFTPERTVLEHRLLGLPPPAAEAAWHPQDARDQERIDRLAALASGLLAATAQRGGPLDDERELHAVMAVYVVYHRFLPQMAAAALAGPAAPLPWYDDFADAAAQTHGRALPRAELDHLLACLIQVRRAFAAIFEHLVGASAPMARLRADCWRSVFGADLARYRRSLWARMRDFPTLVTGPSGSGKELVARAVGRSGYIPVDGRGRRLAGGEAESFLPLSISALAPALVEGELFGHRRGAFTGATEERAGWLEVCPAHGCVFLDEIGEVEPAVQVKLLRVLQTRVFSRVGEHAPRTFAGRLVAATNRDLAAGIADGSFRADVYYRLCADQIRTPALRELLDADPGELDRLCLALAARIAGPDEAPRIAAESTGWIRRELGEAYPWPGNVRELEQCLRNLLVRGAYRPSAVAAGGLADAVRDGGLDAETLLDRYCAQVATQAGGWRPAARRLGLDWRTVKLRAERAAGKSEVGSRKSER